MSAAASFGGSVLWQPKKRLRGRLLQNPLCAKGKRPRTLHRRRHFASKEQWPVEYIVEREGERGKQEKIKEFGALPSPSPITSATQATSWRPHSSVPRFLPNLVVITKTQTFASVFRHQCSSPDIYRFGQKWFKVIIKNFRDTSFYYY